MTRIVSRVVIRASPAAVWQLASELAAQPEWMGDLVGIRFASEETSGLGVVMDCDTRIGPVRLTDRMVVTEWQERQVIAIRHEGLIRGTGRFCIEPHLTGTWFTWTEDLQFPWWLGGSAAGAAARPVLAATFRRDLAGLKRLAESTGDLSAS
jgi:Polyketide cyclase / dehydrase and lipid transport